VDHGSGVRGAHRIQVSFGMRHVVKNSKLLVGARITAALAMITAVRGAFGDLGGSVLYNYGDSYTQNFDSLTTYSSGTNQWTINAASPTPEAIDYTLVPLPILNTDRGIAIDMTGGSAEA
jgi:hypothetical protein